MSTLSPPKSHETVSVMIGLWFRFWDPKLVSGKVRCQHPILKALLRAVAARYSGTYCSAPGLADGLRVHSQDQDIKDFVTSNNGFK